MKTVRTVLFVAFTCCITQLCSLLAAEEIKYPSPDGRFALRITDEQKVELIEKASGRVMPIWGGLAQPRADQPGSGMVA